MDAGLAFVRDEVMPTVTGMSGCVGLSMLADRETGRCIVTSAWSSEEAMRMSEDAVRALRERGTEIFAGPHEVHEWEVAIMHRLRETGPGACVRVTWGQLTPDGMERALDTFRMAVLPKAEDLPGFCSISVLVDRRGGSSVAATTFDSRAALTAARDGANRLRDAMAAEIGAKVLETAEFELVLAHLRVPETV